jgi:large-conductance mechanosensitive channel
MGIFKTIGKIFFSTLFIISLTLTILLLTFIKITNYETIKEIAIPMINAQLNLTQEQKTLALQYLKYKCENESRITFDVGKNITIDCKDVTYLKEENLSNYLATKILDSIYFEKYNCRLQECIEIGNLMYFMSFDFNNSLKEIFNYLLLATIVFGVVYFVLIETIENKLLSSATIFILTSLPYFFSDYLFSLFSLLPSKFSNHEIFASVAPKIKTQLDFMIYFLIFGLLLLIIYLIIILKKRRLLKKNK